MGLTDKQRKFIDHYIISLNATQAAISAGYSENSAAVIGHENLRKPNIKSEIDQRLAETTMTATEVLRRLADMARGDVGDFVNVPLEELINHPQSHLVKKVKRIVDKDGSERTEIELYDAQSALEKLGKYYSLFTDKVETDGNLTIEVVYKDDLSTD
jgi:phage terminase small subunit